jgi:serine/threonine protein kinase
MAPEIFKKSSYRPLFDRTPSYFYTAGHAKPVDIWAMGVVTYFLLAGYTPFDRDSQQLEMEAIIAGDYKFEPTEYWANVSQTAKNFVTECLTIDPAMRPTAAKALQHKVRRPSRFLGADQVDEHSDSGLRILRRTLYRIPRRKARLIYCLMLRKRSTRNNYVRPVDHFFRFVSNSNVNWVAMQGGKLHSASGP